MGTGRGQYSEQTFNNLLASTQAGDILGLIARCIWETDGEKGECPVPTLNDIARYEPVQLAHDASAVDWNGIGSLPARAIRDVMGIEGSVYETPELIEALDQVSREFENIDKSLQAFDNNEREHFDKYLEMSGLLGFFTFSVMLIEDLAERIEAIHRNWRDARKFASELIHPLAPVVREWIEKNPPTVDIEKRQSQISPKFLEESRNLMTSVFMPISKLHPQGEETPQLYLPDFSEDDDDIIVHVLPIELYKGGRGTRGAPLDERIFFNALLARPYGTPEAWNGVRIEPTLRDFVNWLYPKGWHKTNQLPLLQKALHEVHNKRISYERRDWNVVQVLAMPNHDTKMRDKLPLIIRYPDGVKGNGPLIDVHQMRLYGLVSASKWRAWIRLHYLWDKSKQRNGGSPIYATIPEAKRNGDGYLLDTRGEVITSETFVRKNGKRSVRKGTKPQTAWYHPHAVWIGETRNPQCEKIPVLSDKNLVALFFDTEKVDRKTFWKRLYDAKKAATEMEQDGVILIERDAVDTQKGIKGWRLIQVYQENIRILTS